MANAYRSVLASGSPTPPTPTGIVYGFHIDSTVADSTNAITYIEDAVGMTPAHMDFTNDVFDYGSWENAFFMPKPCMLKYDGTVDYYLDPDDYTKKADGTPSDVADPTYNGNAMMEWGQNGKKIWVKYEADANNPYSGKVYISDTQMDEHYHDWSFHNCLGISGDHFYTFIYNGSIIDNKLRSLSGQAIAMKKNLFDSVTLAKANNPSTTEMWNIECIADHMLIQMLTVLIFKTTNVFDALGYGLTRGNGSEALINSFSTGAHDTKGLFYGTANASPTTSADFIKLFGMENYYGAMERRVNGLVDYYNTYKIKLTYGTEDGSMRVGYDDKSPYSSGDGYKYVQCKLPNPLTGGVVSKMTFTEDGLFPTVFGSGGIYVNTWNKLNAYKDYATHIGRYWGRGLEGGLFGMNMTNSYTAANLWYVGFNLSCKPVILGS